jgi:hypothetical protein
MLDVAQFFALLYIEVCANCPTTVQHSTKHFLTTKITKATKGSDILIINFVLFMRFVVKFSSTLLVAVPPH